MWALPSFNSLTWALLQVPSPSLGQPRQWFPNSLSTGIAGASLKILLPSEIRFHCYGGQPRHRKFPEQPR